MNPALAIATSETEAFIPAFGQIPTEMREAMRWMNYRLEPDPKHPEKPRKVPMRSRTIGRKASSIDARSWATFDESVAALASANGYDGLGFALGDGWVGIDCDHCVDVESEEIALWALEIVGRLESYTELSPSGTGLHVIVRGAKPDGWTKWGNVEIYSRDRYFTVTGRRIDGTSTTVQDRSAELARLHADLARQREGEKTARHVNVTPSIGQSASKARRHQRPDDDAELLDRARRSHGGARFTRLYAGDWEGYPSQSEADLALAGDLMFWCDGDAERVDRLFRASGLMREKWSARHGDTTYGARTISMASASWQRRPRRLDARTQPLRAELSIGPTAVLQPLPQVVEAVELPPELSEDALARAFTDRYRDELRYTAAFAAWSRWSASRWARDDTLVVFDLVRGVCREQANACEKPRIAAALASAKTIAAVERLARADRVHATAANQWDADPWLLGTPDGTVDIRTGELRTSRREDYITKQTAVTPSRGAPLWIRFLETVTNGDTALLGFLQRMAGYCLTGDTRAHALFFLYGTGGNGKGVFINTITAILGDYATVAPIETFTATANDRHPTELAYLKGARLVASQETESGRRWAESKLKSITGGDPISARYMRGDFFTFTPEFKLVIAGNHRPHLRSVDEAIRRRLHLIPFTRTIPTSERDEKLPVKLRPEWPGILAWAIDGALLWQRDGLCPPTSVLAATEDYFDDEDLLQSWIDERCRSSAMGAGRAADLFENWKRYCEDRGEQPGSMKRFTQSLRSKGFEPARDKSARRIQGLVLLAEVQPAST